MLYDQLVEHLEAHYAQWRVFEPGDVGLQLLFLVFLQRVGALAATVFAPQAMTHELGVLIAARDERGTL